MLENREKQLIILLTIFITEVILYKILIYFHLLNNVLQIIFAILIAVVGIFACLKLTKITKTSSDLTYLPFGPSLLIMTFVVVFYGEKIWTVLSKLV